MGVGGIFKFIFRRLLELFVIGIILVFIPNLPPYANFSKSVSVVPSKPLTGSLALNERLNDVEIWHKGDLVGPEAFVDLNGELYTALYTGDIVKLTGEHITPVVKFGKPCKHNYEERICGRPLGMEFDKNGYLIAADSYYGLFRVNVKTGEKEQLVSPETEIGGKRCKIFNSVAIASNGDIYWTDSSTDFLLEDGAFTLLADPTGRLIHYDAKTKKNRVLIDSLAFANGVALSEDEEFVIVAETYQSRFLRYYLKGPKKGTHDIFVDGLPGLPDNVKADGKGGFLVSLVFSQDAEHPNLFQSIGPFPLIRKALARYMAIPEYLFKKSDEWFPNEFSARAVHFIGHFTTCMSAFQSDRTTLLRLNKNGEITDSVHNLNKKISGIAEMHVFRDTLYLGSPFNDYIARIPLAKVGWEDLKQDDRVKRAAPVEAPKPTEAPKTTPKPTTATTARPTTTTTPKPTTTTSKPPTTTTSKPSTTTQKPTTTQEPVKTSTSKPVAATQKPQPTQKPVPTPQPAPKQQQAPPQASQTPPPAKQASPTPQTTNAPSKQQQTPPAVKQQTPPIQQQAPPVKQQAPPPVKQQDPPPVKRQTPPVQQQAQPQQKQAPSTKEQPKPAQTNQQPNKK